MTKFAQLSLALLSLGCLSLPACMTCGAVGGIEGLRLDVSIAGTLPPGAYTTFIRADNQELVLDEIIQADGAVVATPIADVLVDGKHLYATSTVFPRSGTITVGFREGGGPANVYVELRRGTTVFSGQRFAPSYAPAYPNGDSCPPEVEQATDTLVVVVAP
jgi:hypothetical protein